MARKRLIERIKRWWARIKERWDDWLNARDWRTIVRALTPSQREEVVSEMVKEAFFGADPTLPAFWRVRTPSERARSQPGTYRERSTQITPEGPNVLKLYLTPGDAKSARREEIYRKRDVSDKRHAARHASEKASMELDASKFWEAIEGGFGQCIWKHEYWWMS